MILDHRQVPDQPGRERSRLVEPRGPGEDGVGRLVHGRRGQLDAASHQLVRDHLDSHDSGPHTVAVQSPNQADGVAVAVAGWQAMTEGFRP